MSEQPDSAAEAAAGHPAQEMENTGDAARGRPTSSKPESTNRPLSPRRSRSPSPRRYRARGGSDSRSRSKSPDRYRSNHRGHGHGRQGNGRGGGRYFNRRDRAERKNREYEHLEETDDPAKIREQVEFYFSDANIWKDEHMFVNLVQGSRNMPVPIKDLQNFTRMRRFRPYSAIVEALRESDILNVLDSGEFSGPGKEAVQRKTPIDISYRPSNGAEMSIRDEFVVGGLQSDPILHHKLPTSIYVNDFGEKDIGQVELENFFKPYGAVEVRKRWDDNGLWKGSVFVMFSTAEEQQEFVDQKPQYNGHELHIETKQAYCERKAHSKGNTCDWELSPQEYQKLLKKRADSKLSGSGGTRGRGQGHYRGGSGGRGRGRGHSRGGYGRGSPDYGDPSDSNWKEDRDKFQQGMSYNGTTDKKRKASPTPGETQEHTKKSKTDGPGTKTEIMEDA